jgi:hypothetical protein
MSKTRDQLIERVLKVLGVLAAGQQASGEDSETADDQIEPVLAELASRRIFYVGDYDTYEDDTFNLVAECIAVSLAPEFGADMSALIDPRTQMPRAEDKLKKITRRTGTGVMLKSNELTGTHNARGYWYDWENS